ncbi:MAG: hypothetical protein ACJAXG_001114 [Celeribacter sp.]|jgi:hypothetical protein
MQSDHPPYAASPKRLFHGVGHAVKEAADFVVPFINVEQFLDQIEHKNRSTSCS